MFGLRTSKETTEHTGSYYAASVTEPTQYPTLKGNISVDVCVIGGGFSGVNTALELSERGYKVALIEANRIGWGATGRNGGQIIGGIGHGHERFKKWIGDEGIQALYDMGVECCEIIRERVAKYEIDCDLKWGYADVAIKERHLRDFEDELEWREQKGYAHSLKMVEKAQMQGEYVNSDSYLGALVNTTGYGHVHPLKLCIGEAKAAAGLGAQIFEQSKVTKIVEGDQPEVHTDQGKVTAKFVVTAGNAYMGKLIPKLARKVLPSTSCVVATEPLGDLATKLMPADLAVCDPNTALDYFRLSADGRMLFGGLSNYTGLEPADLEGTMYQRMIKVFPELTGKRIDYGWSGQMGIGINRLPQLGRVSNNVFYIQAYSGHGVAPTHMTARVTADMIDGQAARHDVFSKVKHLSWPGGRVIGRAGMAMGMAYFKLLDAL